MSSIKTEVHNVSQCRQRRTEPQQQGICKEKFVKIGPAVPEVCSRTDRHTDKLIAISALHWSGVTNNVTSFGLVLFGQHIFALSFTIFHSTCIFCIYGMALYWPTLQFYLCVYISFVCWYVAPPGECYYNTVLYNATCVHAVSLNCAKNI